MVTLLPMGTLDGSTSQEAITIGGSSVAVGAGGWIGGTDVSVGINGAEVEVFLGVRVRVGITGVWVSVEVEVGFCVLVRRGVYDGRGVIVGMEV